MSDRSSAWVSAVFRVIYMKQPMPQGTCRVQDDDEILTIYRETLDELYGYVSRRCGGDRQLSEDIVQETWLRAVPEWRRKGMPRQPLAWLRTVAHNLLLNEFRRKKPEPLDELSPDRVLGVIDSGATESGEVAALLNHAIARLPPNQGQLIEAFHFEKARVAQLADSLGISERAVEGRLRRARENLKKELELIIQSNGELQ